MKKVEPRTTKPRSFFITQGSERGAVFLLRKKPAVLVLLRVMQVFSL